MIDPKSLRIGNTVTIENPDAWPELKGVPMSVIGVKLSEHDEDFPESTAHIDLADSDRQEYCQYSQFISGIPLSEQELIRLGFKIDHECNEYSYYDGCEINLRKQHDNFYSVMEIKMDGFKLLEFVHDLQNLKYDLTGTELTYKVENETIKP